MKKQKLLFIYRNKNNFNALYVYFTDAFPTENCIRKTHFFYPIPNQKVPIGCAKKPRRSWIIIFLS